MYSLYQTIDCKHFIFPSRGVANFFFKISFVCFQVTSMQSRRNRSVKKPKMLRSTIVLCTCSSYKISQVTSPGWRQQTGRLGASQSVWSTRTRSLSCRWISQIRTLIYLCWRPVIRSLPLRGRKLGNEFFLSGNQFSQWRECCLLEKEFFPLGPNR